jgi:predicted lipoprotein with Yx(FWY)xxD motif
MKHFIQLTFLTIILAGSTNFHSYAQTNEDSVSMGAGYANDIYYSFENGEVASAPRANWDIAFYTLTWSAGIIINDGKGVELYLYPTTDTSGWSSVDTTGLSSWPVLFNSTTDWEEGAFNRNQLGHPDYGWGVYNTITHDVVGDSIYILKLDAATYKKFQVIKKVSIQNTYYFRYADLDGSNEVNEMVDCSDYDSKNFVYYSLTDQTLLDREPASESWDILFSKYMGLLEGGVPYPVTGVLNNINIPANRFDQVGPDFEDWTAAPMDSTKSPIGHDWKYFDMNTFSYVVEDSIAFFVMNSQKDVYKLVFSVFDYTVGKVVFSKSKVHASGVPELSNGEKISIYPNPARDLVHINLKGINDRQELSISDLSGKVMYRSEVSVLENISIPVGDLDSGVYLLTVQSGSSRCTQKLIIQ